MNKVQLFRNEEFNSRFDDWIGTLKDTQLKLNWLLYDNIIASKFYGYYIWDNNLSDLAEYFTREYFADNFNAIIGALQVAGTYEAYLIILRSALGDGVVVTFDSPNPSHLIINIVSPTGASDWAGFDEGFYSSMIPDQIQYPDSNFVFGVAVSNLTINETLKLIDLLNVNGVFVEVNIT